MLAKAPKVALAAAALAFSLAAGPGSAYAGITTRTLVSSTQIRPGVYWQHFRITASGVWGVQQVWRLSWTIGNPHVRLHSSLLGSYNPANQWIRDHPISYLGTAGAPIGMIAAMTADFSSYKSSSPTQSKVSGILVQKHVIYHFDGGSPAVGYMPNGDFIMGTPQLRPDLLQLPGGITTTVGKWNPTPVTLADIHSDQVGVYTTPGTVVTIPAGYEGFRLDSAALLSAMRGKGAYTNPTNPSATPEWVAAYHLTDPAAPPQSVDMPMVKPAACPTGVCASGALVRVPIGGVVMVARSAHPVATALETLAAQASPAIPMAISDVGWSAVSDLTGGKPQLVTNGAAVSVRPAYVDPWQWDCGGGCWRPALVRSSTGKGWLIVIGQRGGAGMTMPQFASVLRSLGAQQAMGFDNNNSAELWRVGHTPVTGYGYERLLPTATSISYR